LIIKDLENASIKSEGRFPLGIGHSYFGGGNFVSERFRRNFLRNFFRLGAREKKKDISAKAKRVKRFHWGSISNKSTKI